MNIGLILINFYWLLFFVHQKLAQARISLNFVNNDDVEDIIKPYVPTVNARNDLCRNDSLFYIQELKEYKMWATQMFDATTKFPTGFLEGSSYDFGNFDECIDSKVHSGNRQFTGKYCLAKFTLKPLMTVTDFKISNDYSNYTMWNKIADYLHDPSKNPRNDLRFAFCMPSTCSHSDLRETLLEVLDKFNEEVSFKVTVDVDDLTCQVRKKFRLDVGDILFLLVVAIAVINLTIGSLYDFLTKKEAFRHFKYRGRTNDLLLCFSIQKNITKLTTVSNNADSLNCMAGMKVYSMFMIIMLHRNMFDFGAAITNPKYVEKLYSEFGATFLLNGPILVDTFFTISGFLASYLALYYFHNTKGKCNILQLYIHRYVRLTSTYWIIIAFYCTLFVKLGNGPLWREMIEFEQQKCKEVWWANLLYINNYYDTKNYCMFQSWYMACDTNAFMLVPLIGLLLYKKPVIGLFSVLLLIGVSTVAVFATVYVYDEMPILLTYMRMVLHPNEDSTFLRIYIPGHLRAGAYFLGVLTGYLKYRMNLNNWKISIQFIKICWIMSVILLFVSLHLGFVFYVLKVPTWISALYASFHRLGWSVGISWILIATSSGYGILVNRILSWYPLVVLSRLTYTVYLCHGIIQMYSAGTRRHPVYVSSFNEIHRLAADIVFAYILAFVLTLLFESPIVGLEKIILGGNKTTPSKKSDKMESTELPTVG